MSLRLDEDPGTWSWHQRDGEQECTGGWQFQEMCVCVSELPLKEGQRETGGSQEMIKRLKKTKCLENRISNSVRLRMELGGVGVYFLGRLLILCRQELCNCDEKMGVRPRNGQVACQSGLFLKRTKVKICKLNQHYHLFKYTLVKIPEMWH